MTCCTRRPWLWLGFSLLSAFFLLGGSCLGGSGPTDCYEMRTETGTTTDGEPCVCQIFFPSTDGSASGPVCHQRCQADGREVFDCSASRI